MGSELTRSFLATVVLVGVVLVSTVVLYAVLLVRIQPQHDRLVDARDALDDAYVALTEQEAAIRGSLLTGDGGFVTAQSDAAAAAADARARARMLLSDEGGFASDLDALRTAERSWRATWVAPTLATGGADAAAASTAGAVHAEYAEVYEAVHTRIDSRIGRLATDERRMLWWGAGTSLVACVALLVTVRAQRGLSRKGRAAQVGLERERFLSDAQAGALAAKSGQLAGILRMNAQMSGAQELRYVTDSVCETARSISGFAEAEVVLVLDQLERDQLSEDEVVKLVLGTRRAAFRAATPRGTMVVRSLPGPVVEVALPMVVHATVIGVLAFRNPEPIVLATDLLDVLEAIASQGAAAIDAAVLHDSLERAAEVDALTGLLNRRRLDHEIDAGRRTFGATTAVMMVDIDHFKSINDSRGHQRGDDVLRHVAGLLTSNLREDDTAYRYGGEEFLVLMPNTEVNDAVGVVTRLAAAVRASFPDMVEGRPLTVSAGITVLGDRPLADAIREADGALYRAKQEGRDRIVLAA